MKIDDITKRKIKASICIYLIFAIIASITMYLSFRHIKQRANEYAELTYPIEKYSLKTVKYDIFEDYLVEDSDVLKEMANNISNSNLDYTFSFMTYENESNKIINDANAYITDSNLDNVVLQDVDLTITFDGHSYKKYKLFKEDKTPDQTKHNKNPRV